ncbi:helix-turn-helix domain-containing protein [Streptomyces sp. NBC_00669]|uniref:helix-turn-helix domain-containing protein n=1 Tax=unclassified Streptomyces TaxID=2593676 RepID=UPI002E350EA3|nr:helix-turn-helix domain-containing protein [Streptomyces sp. NBC_00669]
MSPRSTFPDVLLIRWPAQSELREECQRGGIPHLLVVEGGAPPPLCVHPYEDWVRPPISQDDLDIRIATLRTRVRTRRPSLNSADVLGFGSRSVGLTATQSWLMGLFIERFREVVQRDELLLRLRERSADLPTRNAFDLHIMRLRQRLSIVGLTLDTAWGHGYVLQPVTDPSQTNGPCSRCGRRAASLTAAGSTEGSPEPSAGAALEETPRRGILARRASPGGRAAR